MIDTELEDILTVLAIGVYADKRIFASEIQAFTRSVSGVELSKRENSKVSGAKALMWFETHKMTFAPNLMARAQSLMLGLSQS